MTNEMLFYGPPEPPRTVAVINEQIENNSCEELQNKTDSPYLVEYVEDCLWEVGGAIGGVISSNASGTTHQT